MNFILLSFIITFCQVEANGSSDEIEEANRYFNDSFARDIMFVLAAAAYADDPQPCLTNRIREATVVRNYKAECGPLPLSGHDYCYGYTAISHFHRAIIISFRGVDQITQYVMKKFQEIFEKKASVHGGGKVGRYLHDAYNSVWSAGMYKDVLWLRDKYPSYEVWITGHSLGGSMSSIAAHELAAGNVFDKRRIIVVTFGEPRTGDAAFAVMHNKLLKYCYRVVHHNDFMPHTPLTMFKYRHYKYEVWYDNRMERGDPYKFCEAAEDKNCSVGHFCHISPFDHINYYTHSFLTFGTLGCVNRG